MHKLQVLLDENQIQERVKQLAASIARAYGDKPILVVGLLDNAFMLTADVVRHLPGPVRVRFCKMEVQDTVEYGHDRRAISYLPPVDPADKDVVIVDVVLNTGVTHDLWIQNLLSKGARSVRLAVLLDKAEQRRVAIEPDFVGQKLELESGFLVGYGLAHEGLYRNLPHIAVVETAGRTAPAATAHIG